MKVEHLAIAHRIGTGNATAADFDALDRDPAGYAAVAEHQEREREARELRDDAAAHEVLAGCFAILGRLLKQVEDNATAQAETARALTEGLRHVERLAEVLAAPRIYEAVADLPEGPVRFTVRHRREPRNRGK